MNGRHSNMLHEIVHTLVRSWALVFYQVQVLLYLYWIRGICLWLLLLPVVHVYMRLSPAHIGHCIAITGREKRDVLSHQNDALTVVADTAAASRHKPNQNNKKTIKVQNLIIIK